MGAAVRNILFKMGHQANVTLKHMPMRRAHAAHRVAGAEIAQTIVNVRDAKISEV